MSTNLGPIIKDEDVAQRCVDALCATYGYQPEIPEPITDELQDDQHRGVAPIARPKVPNPQTPLEFAQSRVEAFVLEIVRAHELEAVGQKVAAETLAIEAL